MLHFNFRNIISFGYTDFWSKNYLILYPFLGILTSHIVNSRRICTLVGNLEESQTNNFLWKCTLGCLPSYWGVKNICYGGWWKLLALFCNQDQKNRGHNVMKWYLKEHSYFPTLQEDECFYLCPSKGDVQARYNGMISFLNEYSHFVFYLYCFLLKVSKPITKPQKYFFLKLHCPKTKQNIWKNSALAS